MYVVLDGRVLISKFIPGAGEEALAFLERGDFFGEMADRRRARSADARAHGGPLTVLALDQATIREMLALDPQARSSSCACSAASSPSACARSEKVVGWRISPAPATRTPWLSGARPTSGAGRRAQRSVSRAIGLLFVGITKRRIRLPSAPNSPGRRPAPG